MPEAVRHSIMLIVAQRPGIDDLGMCDAEERFFKAVAKGPERIQRADLSEREHIFADRNGRLFRLLRSGYPASLLGHIA